MLLRNKISSYCCSNSNKPREKRHRDLEDNLEACISKTTIRRASKSNYECLKKPSHSFNACVTET